MSSVPMLDLLGLRSSHSAASASGARSSTTSSEKSPSSKASWLPSLARQPTSDGTLDVKTGDVGKGEAQVPTPRVAEPLPVLLGRTRFNPQRARNTDVEVSAQVAREAFLERQARRASRVTG
eukprot:Skav223086  [mRNA]  locus=scaffold419:277497:277862:+ [translate_table: standard]